MDEFTLIVANGRKFPLTDVSFNDADGTYSFGAGFTAPPTGICHIRHPDGVQVPVQVGNLSFGNGRVRWTAVAAIDMR